MKKFRSIFLSMAALLFAASCQVIEEYKPQYKPGTPDVEGCQKVYFPSQDLSAYEYLSPEAECVFEVTIARELDEEAVVVPVEVDANVDDIFQFDDVRFEAGQKETTFQVTFDKAEIGKLYTATFSVKDPNFASKYSSAPTFLQFKTMRVEWKYVLNEAGEPAQFTFEEEWWKETHTGKVKYYEIDGVRYCQTETDPMEYEGGTGYGFFGLGDAPGEGELSLVWYTNLKTPEGYDAVELIPYNLGNVAGYGVDVMMWDWWHWWTVAKPQSVFEGKDFAYFVKNYYDNYNCSYYDNGIFAIHVAYYYMDGVGGWEQDKKETVMTADGFTRIDYSLDMKADYTVEGVLPLYFKAGADVAEVKVAAAQGKLSAADLSALKEGIADGSIESKLVDLEELALGLEFEATDIYTVAAVAFNEAGEVVNSADVVAFFVAPDDEEEYAVKASIGFEALPERYELDPYHHAAYWIAGEDLTDVHMAIVKAESLTKAALEAIKADAAGKYALDAEDLEKVNGVGGLYDYAEGLDPDTEYALVVWATNGSLEKFFLKTYTTEKLPYVWNFIGEGVWTDTIISEFFKVPEEINVPADVYEEVNNPGLYKVNNFALHLIAELFETTEEEMKPYAGNWHEVDLLIDATNPAKVVMDLQDYGVCLSTTYGFFLIGNRYAGEVVEYGKLEDGKITFAKGKFFAGLPAVGLFDDCNASGKTGLTLPSSESLTSVSVANSQPKNYVELPEMPLKSIAKNAYKAEKIAIERDIHVVDAKIVKIAPKAKANRNSEPKAVKLNSIR